MKFTILQAWALVTSAFLLIPDSHARGGLADINNNKTTRNLNQCNTNPLDPTSSTSGTGYHQWLSSLATGQYPNNIYIPTASDLCDGLAFHWKIDKDASKISIAVAAKADGWAAIGFSETGGMKGADIVYYVPSTGELVDAHVGDGYVKPTTDEIQDWKLNSGQVTDDGFIIFEAERALFTNYGHEDREFEDDSSVHVLDHRIIGAWGDSASISYHSKNVVKGSVQLFSSDDLEAGNGFSVFQQEMDVRADGSGTLKLDNYNIPQAETTYYDECFVVADLVDLGLYTDASSSTYIIGMEFLIDPATVKYAHHILLHGHVDSTTSCDDFGLVLAAWTPGDDFLYFPEGMGLEIGGGSPGSFNSMSLEYHFDNVDGDANKVDNESGIKIYYSNKPVDQEIGLVTMGDGQVNLYGEKIGMGKTKHEFTCPSTCTSSNFEVDEVTVILEAQHMHATGKRIVTDLFRGDEIVNTASIDYWDFDQNGAAVVRQKPYKLKKGDNYHTTCYFESYKNTKFGLGSSEEMCMVFIYYYPKQSSFIDCSPGNFYLPSCSSSYSSSTLASDSFFDRAMSDTTSTPGAPTAAPESISGTNRMASSLFTIVLGIFTFSLLV